MISSMNMEFTKAATKLATYKPQVDVPEDDDPDNYMMLVPAAKKRPILQCCCASLAVVLAIIALCVDEMSDGDVRFTEPLKDEDFLDEVDYDCGWNSFRVNYIYYEDEAQIGGKGHEHWAYMRDTYEYSGSFCEEHDEMVDPQFCNDSEVNGIIWLVFGILGILFFAASIPVIWYQGKSSIIYVILLSLGILMLAIGSLNWLFNDKCEDIEKWSEAKVSFDTTLGASMILIFVSIFCAVIGALITSIHLVGPVQQRKKQEAIQAQQPRIQSHVVN